MNHQEQPLIVHLIELRRRLIYCACTFITCCFFYYCYSDQLFNFLLTPLAEILQTKPNPRKLIFTGLTEAFTTYIKIAIFFATITTLPVFLTQLWKFVAPGLYKQEKKIFFFFIVSTPFLFILGALFAYYVIFPTAYSFFLSFESTQGILPIQLEAKINEYLSFVMRLILSFGICFELPVLLSGLSWMGVLSSQTLIQHWRIAVVVIFSVAAVITPPDILSMLGLAIPLLALYGISLRMILFIEKHKEKQCH